MDDNLMGKMIEVDIISAGKHYLIGTLASGGRVRRPENIPPPLSKGRVSGSQLTLRGHYQGTPPDEYPAHPIWIQFSVMAIIIAILLKTVISVFSPAYQKQ